MEEKKTACTSAQKRGRIGRTSNGCRWAPIVRKGGKKKREKSLQKDKGTGSVATIVENKKE